MRLFWHKIGAMTATYQVEKRALKVEITLCTGDKHPCELFVAMRNGAWSPEEVAAELESRAFLPIHDLATGEWAAVRRDAIHSIVLPAQDGAPSDADQLYEARHEVRVELRGGGALTGALLYSAPPSSTRVLDHVNNESRLLKLWRGDSLILVNKLEIVRVVDLDGTASV